MPQPGSSAASVGWACSTHCARQASRLACGSSQRSCQRNTGARSGTATAATT
ncbi:Uncharacterised protein [Bordetella pertussis]|nr:Uncharacterised protein [Bordetella pertussis]CFW42874.1 Uncharacterised protein [Bordetella pertussis]